MPTRGLVPAVGAAEEHAIASGPEQVVVATHRACRFTDQRARVSHTTPHAASEVFGVGQKLGQYVSRHGTRAHLSTDVIFERQQRRLRIGSYGNDHSISIVLAGDTRIG